MSRGFIAATGLFLNTRKTHMLIGYIARPEAEELAAILNVNLAPNQMNYSLIARQLATADCLPLLVKATARVKDWKNRFLSHAGRLEVFYTGHELSCFQS